MRVYPRMDRTLKKRVKALPSTERDRILEKTIILVTERLNHGVRRRLVKVPADVDEEIGRAFEDAIYQNGPAADLETDKAIRPILTREEMRPR